MTLTKGCKRALALLAAAEADERWEDAEILQDGLACWIGDQRIAARTVFLLLWLMAIRSVGEDGKQAQRYALNDTGRGLHDGSVTPQDIVWLTIGSKPENGLCD